MSESEPRQPVIKRKGTTDYDAVDAAEGLSKGVLIAEEEGAPNIALRRFVLEGGESVPKHTNEVEHEQYVLEGEYVVGLEDEEHTISAGDSIHIPAGTVHWYRNEGEEPVSFLCAVPSGDDTIDLVE
jgi:quercetin dioxygenase-like cupin family protein